MTDTPTRPPATSGADMCQTTDAHGQPVCVRQMRQRPCTACPDAPTRRWTDATRELVADPQELQRLREEVAQHDASMATVMAAFEEDAERLRGALTNIKATMGERIADRDRDLRDVMRERDEARARVAELQAEAVGFAARLGFGDNVSDPAAPLSDMVDPIADAMEAVRDHDECPTHCEGCGETLAATVCQRCGGLGDIGSGAYDECPECAGAGSVHEGCAGASYADLAARVAELEQQQRDPLIAHLVTTAHQWHAAYEAETSPTALADSPGYRQARVALSDAVYRLINAGRLPEHGPLSATPPETAGGEQ